MVKVLTLSKGLVTLGSFGGPSFLFSSSYLSLGGGGQLDREIEIVSKFEGTNWKDGVITPVFDSWWLSGGFKNPIIYSYSYIARAKDTNYSEKTKFSKRTKRSTLLTEGELRLVERVGSLTTNNATSFPKSKPSPHQHLDGLTPKKFFLIGVNRTSNEVEMSGLVSLVKNNHGGIKANCNSKDEKAQAIKNGYCDHVFFKAYYPGEKKPSFVETQLKNNQDKQVGVLGLKDVVGTMNVVFGAGKIDSYTRWSRSAPIRVKVQEKDQNLYTGKKGSNNRPYVVVHDLKFARGALKGKWKEVDDDSKSLIEMGMTDSTSNSYALANESKSSTIPLSRNRQYYLWDPSYTEIKDGTLKTKDGQKLPWKVNFSLPYTIRLVK
ncbi:hypothetical protein WEN_03280 [Mycoplasma wenyonii str. Massachusetts]|uniref:Uncharacterized protein n=1 Tax=Mycoplasma wenyonii (strain Massachusetts) TaxID=1197325 RepID=I6ZJQ1_MYCWM|nr:hypothetical protein [Mycoplasma wenyonii]AFN65435.1 hypothetical protein WEN_03280 [Mycoplasma wenyonii str. Massachusetts]